MFFSKLVIILKKFERNGKSFSFYLNNLNDRKLSNVSSIHVFDRKVKRLQREKSLQFKDSHIYDYIRDEIAFRLSDRVYDIKRTFPIVVDFGSHKGFIGKHLSNVEILLIMFNIVLIEISCLGYCRLPYMLRQFC